MAAGSHVLVATGYSGAVRLAQWCVVALIFLFFLRVIRAVWVEVRPAGPRHGRSNPRSMADPRVGAGAAPRRGKGPLALEVIEPLDRAGQRFEIGDELTIGRSPGCGISTAYDIYSSTVHARLFHQDGRLFVEDLGSTNGTYVNDARIGPPVALNVGDRVQVGQTVLELSS